MDKEPSALFASLRLVHAPGLIDAVLSPVLRPHLAHCKSQASGMPVVIMAGILAESESATLRLPGRDPRSTMNALYHADAVKVSFSNPIL